MRSPNHVKDNIMSDYSFRPIGFIRSCFPEKFGIPRQPGLVPEAKARLEILPPFQSPEAFRELETFSHIWIVFVFHQCLDGDWRATVRPPRLGGNRRVGVFASRSGFRPNPIGQSAVELVGIERSPGRTTLQLRGVDLLDGTPVLDIKPYLPYCDALPQAAAGYAAEPPAAKMTVAFTPQATRTCRQLEDNRYYGLQQLITDLLALDPRPGYADQIGKQAFGMRLWDLNIRFKVEADHLVVESIDPAPDPP
jgi:tRNA-Thr(GGU) m(6)t(6)A37 methyltransferase TsaA